MYNMATAAGFSNDYSNDKGKSESNMGPGSLNFQLIDKESQIKPAIDDISKGRDTGSMIAVDCEGELLSRRGKLSVVSIATEDQIYIFDIQALGESVFDKGLRRVLEDTTQKKLMFDCRQDSDCLKHQYQVKLANVLDLQLLEILGSEAKDSTLLKGHPRLESFLSCLETYVKDEDLIKAKEEGKLRMRQADVWLERPFDPAMLKYAACDVMGFFKLYSQLMKHLCDSHLSERLRIASGIYLDFFRSRPNRCYDIYETNSFLPMYVIPAKGNLCFPPLYKECVGCKRKFPYADFSKTQLRKGTQRCPVCKEIKRGIDEQENRARQREAHYDGDCSDSSDYSGFYDYFDSDDCFGFKDYWDSDDSLGFDYYISSD